MRFQSLEAFRGLAAIFIILYHSLFTTSTLSAFRINSYLFVDFFFILSGFIISYAYLDKLEKNGIQAKNFLLKRVFRLYPLHLFMLFIWLIYIVLKHEAFLRHIGGQDPFIAHTLTSFMEHLLLVQTWGTGNIMSWNVPSWSISVEILAYILFLIFTFSFHDISNRIKVLFLILFIALCKSLLYFYPENLKDFSFLLNGLSAFFLGLILYIFYSKKRI